MIDLKYRPDVDGLRAVAVLLVLLFHADLGFTGGFVGVDVFFVISGFLITGLILKKQRESRFALSQYWIRRIRRILPASILMTGVTLIVGGFILMPPDYQNLGASALAQQLMVSNFYFWQNTGYFDAPANLQPLMHTWSLAVEEQFYLIFPFLLYSMGRFSSRVQLSALIPLFCMSFIASEWCVQNEPSAAYFLLPSRAWEMILGGLICYLPVPTTRFQKINGFFSLASLTTIIACGWYYHESQPFPGVTAALPVFATALFIYVNSGQMTSTARLLATKPCVFIGLISYSLYLAHWPILAFVRTQYGNEISPTLGATCLISSFAIAYLSWRFVEQPVRKQVILKSTRALIGASVCVPALLMFGAFTIYQSQGLPDRLPEKARFYYTASDLSQIKNYQMPALIEDVKVGKVQKYGDLNSDKLVLLWGDSHAMAVMPGLEQACLDSGVCCYRIHSPGNPPIFNMTSPFKPFGDKAIALNDATREFIRNQKIQEVVFAAFWFLYSREDPKAFEDGLLATVDELQKMGVNVTIIEDVAIQKYDIPSRLAQLVWQNERTDSLGVPLGEHRKRNQIPREVFQKLKDRGVRVYDPAKYFVDEKMLWRAELDGLPMYRDPGHLSIYGGQRLRPMFKEVLNDTHLNIAGENWGSQE